MPWFKVDDSFCHHPKVINTGLDALGLWVLAGAWCGANMTDGFIADSVVRWLTNDDSDTAAAKLVTAGLWQRTRGGYRFHDWRRYNPSRDAVESQRASNRERQRRYRDRRRNGVTNGVSHTSTKDVPRNAPRNASRRDTVTRDFGQFDDESPGHAPKSNGVSHTLSVTHPTRPVTQPSNEGCESARVTRYGSNADGRGGRATRIPDSFRLTAEMIDWARRHAPDVDAERATAGFVDYWRAKPGKAATKVDWLATWRNWLRRDQDNAERRGTRDRNAPATHPTDATVLRLLGGGDSA